MLYTIAIITILAAAPAVFTVLLFYTAPYGRHFRRGWGPTVTARTGWVLMEAPSLLIIAAVVLPHGRQAGTLGLLLLGLWEAHYLYRACIFPFLLRGSTKRFPVVVILFAWVFNGLNAYANGVFLAGPGLLTMEGTAGRARVAIGVALFVAGFATHARADSTLRHLRKPGETGYAIPRGWLFEYVASPNYLGEIMQWCGWALATWSLPGLAFALFTVANLMPRALAHRRWYASTFPDYPRDRKSVIPFIF